MALFVDRPSSSLLHVWYLISSMISVPSLDFYRWKTLNDPIWIGISQNAPPLTSLLTNVQASWKGFALLFGSAVGKTSSEGIPAYSVNWWKFGQYLLVEPATVGCLLILKEVYETNSDSFNLTARPIAKLVYTNSIKISRTEQKLPMLVWYLSCPDGKNRCNRCGNISKLSQHIFILLPSTCLCDL